MVLQSDIGMLGLTTRSARLVAIDWGRDKSNESASVEAAPELSILFLVFMKRAIDLNSHPHLFSRSVPNTLENEGPPFSPPVILSAPLNRSTHAPLDVPSLAIRLY